jgi:hypothetical protein
MILKIMFLFANSDVSNFASSVSYSSAMLHIKTKVLWDVILCDVIDYCMSVKLRGVAS